MDTLRGQFSDHDTGDFDAYEDDTGREPPPSIVGQDERRMQVRAYNFWASLLDNRSFPSVEELDPANHPDFGPYSVLLDFTCGVEDPAIQFLGESLAGECGTTSELKALSDVPGRSLLSRITDHYMQILANQAPIGFEAEFVNHRGATLLYRGILLPFSSDDDTIDFIYGVINWKELADPRTSDELLLEIDQALESMPEILRQESPMTEWADGPADRRGVLDLAMPLPDDLDPENILQPAFAPSGEAGDGSEDEDESKDEGEGESVEAHADRPHSEQSPDDGETDEPEAAEDTRDFELADWLASARNLALAASKREDRSRAALYAAIGRAYDFSLAAAEAPERFAELLEDAGLTAQDRAPMTPVVKLVFGADYDKTRLTEYAAVLGHAHRTGLERGSLAAYLARADGGLKGIVAEERRRKRAETGAPAAVPRQAPRAALARLLRKLEFSPIAQVPGEGSEFALLVARRLPTGEVVLLGEVSDDVPLLEKAARKLV